MAVFLSSRQKRRNFSAHHAVASNVMHDGTAVAKNLTPALASIWFRIEKPSPHAMAPPGPAPGTDPWEPQIGPIACGLAFCFWRTLFFCFFFWQNAASCGLQSASEMADFGGVFCEARMWAKMRPILCGFAVFFGGLLFGRPFLGAPNRRKQMRRAPQKGAPFAGSAASFYQA